MSKVLVTESYLEDIAATIRSKTGGAETLRPGEMAAAIASIPGAPALQVKTVTENGVVTPDAGYDGFSRVTVNVPNRFTAADEGKVVDNGALAAQTGRTVTANGTYDTTLNDEVTVNVSCGGSTLVTKTITQNGTYNASSDNADGYSQVFVNVSGSGGGLSPTAITPTIYTASYIGQNGSLSMNNSSYPNYCFIAIELSQYSGKLIRIQNSGDRNFYGLFSSVTGGNTPMVFSGRQTTSGELVIYADDYPSNAGYLVYDYTSSAENAPTVTTYDINL